MAPAWGPQIARLSIFLWGGETRGGNFCATAQKRRS